MHKSNLHILYYQLSEIFSNQSLLCQMCGVVEGAIIKAEPGVTGLSLQSLYSDQVTLNTVSTLLT